MGRTDGQAGYTAEGKDSREAVCPVPEGKPTPPFGFRAIGKATGEEGRYKYAVIVDGEPVERTGEDPEIDICDVKHCY